LAVVNLSTLAQVVCKLRTCKTAIGRNIFIATEDFKIKKTSIVEKKELRNQSAIPFL